MKTQKSIAESCIFKLIVFALIFHGINFAGTHPVRATPPPWGSLIKGSSQAVYYLHTDEKRYVFPNEKVFFSWYDSFVSVKTISDAELAALPIGGNVTYRPGLKMVKIQTTPKVYAVDHGGVLRWIASETIASALYGPHWNTKIDDISEAYFTNYQIGSPIDSSFVYSVVTALASSPTIAADKTPIKSAIPPIQEKLPDLIVQSLSVSPTNPKVDDKVTFSGVVKNRGEGDVAISSLTQIRLDLDNNGTWNLAFGSMSTGVLGANVVETETWQGIWTATLGTHKFIICADWGSAISESSETNNCSEMTFTVAEKVTEVISQSDLIVQSLTVSPMTSIAGDKITFSGTVRDQGTGSAGSSSTYLRLDIGNDGSWDLALGVQSTGALASMGAETKIWSEIWTSTVGTHKFQICADYYFEVSESNENNNCSEKTFTVIIKSIIQENSDYLIIVSDTLITSGLKLKEYRSIRGKTVSVVRVSDIGTSPTATMIDNWIETFQQRHPRLRFVVLLGDLRAIPSHAADIPSATTIWTDLPYATQQQTYGPTNYMPNLLIGRIPAQTIGEFDAYYKNILAFETMFNTRSKIVFFWS